MEDDWNDFSPDFYLFIHCISSYLFTWQDDQSQVLNKGVSFLFDNNKDSQVTNLLGRLGAYTSHNLIYNGFGLASFLFCTFFFVLGINLVFERKVFSIWRNLKYVTVGLLILSVSFAFIFTSASFPFGGQVGQMINNWMINLIGNVGTAAVLLVIAVSYIIWQFNPTFKLPARKLQPEITGESNETITDENEISNNEAALQKKNQLKVEGGILVNVNGDMEDALGLEMIEKDEEESNLSNTQTIAEHAIVNDLLHKDEIQDLNDLPIEAEEEELLGET